MAEEVCLHQLRQRDKNERKHNGGTCMRNKDMVNDGWKNKVMSQNHRAV